MLGQAVSGITELLAILNTGHAADKISGFLLQPHLRQNYYYYT